MHGVKYYILINKYLLNLCELVQVSPNFFPPEDIDLSFCRLSDLDSLYVAQKKNALFELNRH